MSRALLSGARIVTLTGPGSQASVTEGAVLVEGGRILWVGPSGAAPEADTVRDLEGRLVTPGLIDCHTHLVHGGHRAGEFAKRLAGASYADIARAGGGIAATVAATRAASLDDLVATALPRLDRLIGEGVTTVEIKSGYGLDIETELRMLQAARALGQARAVRVRTSFLGAHAVPPEFKADRAAYLHEVCLPALRRAAKAGLADAVDGFCEGIAFSPAEIATVFAEAKALGLPLKLHAEQLSHAGGAALAAREGALSADHLEYATPEDAAQMARAGTVAVLLPGAFYTLREATAPPVAAFRKAGVAMALATDCNPGSSPLTSPLLAMNMGCTLFGLTPGEALAGVTRHAARALGLDDVGQIAPGFRADLAIWDVEAPEELAYRIGFNPLWERFFGGIV